MKRTYLYNLIFLVFILVSGCRDKEVPPQAEGLTYLTDNNFKDWKLTKVTYSIIEVTSRIPECQQDEIYRFYADGRGEIRSGELPCTDPEPDLQNSGTWTFENGATVIKIDWNQKQNWDAEILVLKPEEMVVKGKILDDYEVTATFLPL